MHIFKTFLLFHPIQYPQCLLSVLILTPNAHCIACIYITGGWVATMERVRLVEIHIVQNHSSSDIVHHLHILGIHRQVITPKAQLVRRESGIPTRGQLHLLRVDGAVEHDSKSPLHIEGAVTDVPSVC